jgi:hypothetical protein
MTTQSRTQPWPAADWQPALLLAGAGLASALLGGGSLLLLVRRLSGAFDERPSAAAAVATLSAAIVLAVAGRLCVLQAARPKEPRLWVWGVPSLALLWLVAAILPGQHWLLLVLLVAAAACEEGWAWFVAPPWGAAPVMFRVRPAADAQAPAPRVQHAGEVESSPRVSPKVFSNKELVEEELEPELEDDEEALEEEVGEEVGAEVTHQITRRVTAAGVEVSGIVQTTFAPGQRTAIEHVAFCPPFDKTPTAAVHQLAGPEARARVTHVLPHGLRIELRLSQAAVEATCVSHEVAVREA